MNDPHGAASKAHTYDHRTLASAKGCSHRRTPAPYQGPLKPKTLVCVAGCSQQGATPAKWQPKSPTEQPRTQHPKTQAPRRTNGPAWKIPALRNDLNIGTLGALLQAKKQAIELDVASSASASQCLTSEARQAPATGNYAVGTAQPMVGQHGTENAMNCIPAQLHKAALGPCVREARHAQDQRTAG